MNLKQWLDTFVQNGYPSNKTTEWPEDYGTEGGETEQPVSQYFLKTKLNVDALISHLQTNGYTIADDDRKAMFLRCTTLALAFAHLNREDSEARRTEGIRITWSSNRMDIEYFGEMYSVNISNGSYSKDLIQLLTENKEALENLVLEPASQDLDYVWETAEFTYQFREHGSGSYMYYELYSTPVECEEAKLKALFTVVNN